MDLLEELNDYFGTEVESIQEFKKDLKDEYLVGAQVERLFDFLFYLDRKTK